MKKNRAPGMKVHLLTIFPGYFKGPLDHSLLKKARERGILEVFVHDLRDFAHDRHRTVDDKPYGGGPGMIMKPEPIFECVESIRKKAGSRRKPWVICLDPQGEPLNQGLAKKLAARRELLLISGHYEGIDYRVRRKLADQAVSIGDFITMGGEAPALCLLEAVARWVPGVLGNRESLACESFQGEGLEYPQYTRPRVYRDMKVPAVLVSGNHKEVARWRRETALRLTRRGRRDLIRGEK